MTLQFSTEQEETLRSKGEWGMREQPFPGVEYTVIFDNIIDARDKCLLLQNSSPEDFADILGQTTYYTVRDAWEDKGEPEEHVFRYFAQRVLNNIQMAATRI